MQHLGEICLLELVTIVTWIAGVLKMQRKRCHIQFHRARNKKWNCIDQLRGRMDNDHDHEDGFNMCWTSGPAGMSDGGTAPRKSSGHVIRC